MNNYYAVIASFFDCYDLSHARSILGKIIKTADSEKSWKGRYPVDVLHFSERLQQLIEAAFGIVEQYDFKPEAEINDDKELWFLAKHETYCGWHVHSTPWNFFPRYLSKKEFLDPYKALQKFTSCHSLAVWKMVLKEIVESALSPNSVDETDNGSLLSAWLYLHKLVEATHLIEVRSTDENKKPRFKWKDRDNEY